MSEHYEVRYGGDTPLPGIVVRELGSKDMLGERTRHLAKVALEVQHDEYAYSEWAQEAMGGFAEASRWVDAHVDPHNSHQLKAERRHIHTAQRSLGGMVIAQGRAETGLSGVVGFARVYQPDAKRQDAAINRAAGLFGVTSTPATNVSVHTRASSSPEQTSIALTDAALAIMPNKSKPRVIVPAKHKAFIENLHKAGFERNIGVPTIILRGNRKMPGVVLEADSAEVARFHLRTSFTWLINGN